MPPRVRTRRPSRRRIPVITALLLAGALFGSCGDDTVGDRDPETRARLKRATYLTENTDDDEATLEDGEFRAPVAPGSASMLVAAGPSSPLTTSFRRARDSHFPRLSRKTRFHHRPQRSSNRVDDFAKKIFPSVRR